ncbi:MAG: hypothetical protein Q9216_000256 [Gyalolechia sp. 2 TL-2023]
MASQMGAVHKYDLTSDVTHLIVGDTDTPKYKFVAKERPDVKCLLPTWVEALRQLWIDDVEPDFQALESQYRLPTLHKLRICLTGFEDPAYRKQLEDDINSHGGEYRGNLTKDVTHLIAKDPSGTKYRFAIQWGVKIVAVEWLAQSLERGMILDESLYNLSLPPTERGRNAWIRRVVSTSSLGKRSVEGDSALNVPRKLRRIASAKLNSQNVGLWTDIVSGDFKAEKLEQDLWSKQTDAHKSKTVDGSSVTIKSEATSTNHLNSDSESPAVTLNPPLPSFPDPTASSLLKTGIFAGKRFCLHGFNEKKTLILHKHLLSHGAEILPDQLSFTPATMSIAGNEFLLVPHTISKEHIPPTVESMHQPTVVTDMWVERNLHRKQYISPEANITNTPFQRFPIVGFSHLVICSTGFEDVDLLHMSKAVKLMGATYDEEFSPKASVLVCNKVVPGHEKLRHARHWNVCAVTADWLWDCIRSGEFQDFKPYVVELRSPKADQESDKAQNQSQDQGNSRHKHEAAANQERGSDRTSKSSNHGTHGTEPHTLHAADIARTALDNPIKNISSKEQCLPTPDSIPPPTIFTSNALREISPNSSPPKPTISPSKLPHTWDLPTKPPSQDPALSATISALLAHHQSARSSKSHSTNAALHQAQPPVRRKRQLFGRAPSNASNLSRASSVDTVNTDGIGTPVELTRSASNISTVAYNNSNNTVHPNPKRPITATDSILFDTLADEQAAENNENQEQQLQMTQLGYQDPDALAWRERVERKLGNFSKKDGTESGKVKEIGRVKDLTGRGRRTRQAAGAGK